jgi:hypothetical protein
MNELGIGLPRAAASHVVTATLLSGDSVRVVLNPTIDHGKIVMDGRLVAGRISGRWMVTGYVNGARGAFEMSRER